MIYFFAKPEVIQTEIVMPSRKHSVFEKEQSNITKEVEVGMTPMGEVVI